MVKHPLMVLWVVGLIPHSGSTELVHVPASAPRLVYQMLCYQSGPLPCVQCHITKHNLSSVIK